MFSHAAGSAGGGGDGGSDGGGDGDGGTNGGGDGEADGGGDGEADGGGGDGETGVLQAQHMTSELKSSSSNLPQYDEASTPADVSKPVYPRAQPKPSLSVAPSSVSTHSGGGSTGASQAQHMASELKSSSSKEPQYDERSTPSESTPVYPSAQP